MTEILALLGVLASLFVSPFIAGRMMGKGGSIGKSILAGMLVIATAQLIGLFEFLGPAGAILGIMAWLAAWFQVVKVLYGTDIAETLVFMFWQFFFQVLIASLTMLLLGSFHASWLVGAF